MNHVDLSGKIMDKVVQYERKETSRWIKRFYGAILFFVVVFVGILGIILWQLWQMQTLDIFSILLEDREVISQFWTEVISTFWEELPQGFVLVGGVVLFLLCIFLLITWHKRVVTQRKIRQLAKIGKKGHNSNT